MNRIKMKRGRTLLAALCCAAMAISIWADTTVTISEDTTVSELTDRTLFNFASEGKTLTFGDSLSVAGFDAYGQYLGYITASDSSYGITSSADFYLGNGKNGCNLQILGGTYATSSSAKFLLGYNVSYARTATVELKGGSLNMSVAENRIGGGSKGSTGTLVVNGGSYSSGNQNLILGHGANDTGYLIISNGTATAKGTTTAGNASGASGYIEVAGGELTTSNIQLGNSGSSTGYFCMSGGVANVNAILAGGGGSNANGYIYLSGGVLTNGNFRLGTKASGTGELTVNGQGKLVITSGNTLDAGYTSSGIGNIYISENGSIEAPIIYVGKASSAEALLELTGGEVTVTNILYIADSSATGTVNVKGGSLNVTSANGLRIAQGGSSKGELNVSGGEVKANAILMGYSNYASGSYNQTGGSVWTPNFTAGTNKDYTTNTVCVSAGTLTVTNNLTLADKTTKTDATIFGGSVAVSNILYIARGSKSEASVTVSDDGELYVGTVINMGSAAGAQGNLTVDGGSIWTPNFYIGHAANSTNTINVSSGIVCVTNSISLASQSGCKDTINISGGSVEATNVVQVGRAGGAKGILNVSGGKLWTKKIQFGINKTAVADMTVSGDAVVTVAGDLQLAQDANTTNTLEMTGGTLTANRILIGDKAAKNDVTVSGGTLSSATSEIRIGSAVDSESSLTVSGDGVVVSATDIYLSYSTSGAATGTLTLNGGTVKTATAKSVAIGNYSTAKATVNLNDGVLLTKALTTKVTSDGDGYAKFNWNGGVLAATTANTTLIASGVTTAIGTGGAVISNDVSSVTIAADLTSEETSPTILKKGTGDLTLSGTLPDSVTITVGKDGGSVTVKDTTEKAKVTPGTNTAWDSDSELKLVYSAPSTDIDPTSETTSVEIEAESETAATNAVTVTIPSTISTALETAGTTLTADTYKSYFTFSATETSSGSGVYTVTLEGLSDDVVVTPVDTSALDGLLTGTAGETATVTVKPGLYYGFTPGTSTTLDDPSLTLATGESMTYTIPSGDNTLIAVKVRISATAE